MIIPVWKNIGASTHQLAKEIGKQTFLKTNNPEDLKATHTGTLDPMAEGLVVVLTGKDRFNKGKLTNWRKTYQFEILFGVSTDSLDLLGKKTKLITNILNNNSNLKTIFKNCDNLSKIIPNFIGKQIQIQPDFSAQRIKGKSGFDLAKSEQVFSAKKNEIEIYSLNIIDSKSISLKTIKDTITKKINSVSGDFRQTEIINDWQDCLNILEKNNINLLPIYKMQTVVSKRTYIRSLVKLISEKLNIPATTYSIIRLQEGIYSKEDCK